MDIVEQAEASMCRDNVGCHPDVCVCGVMEDMKDEIVRLRQQVAVMAEALKNIAEMGNMKFPPPVDLTEMLLGAQLAKCATLAKAAIAKATGGE